MKTLEMTTNQNMIEMEDVMSVFHALGATVTEIGYEMPERPIWANEFWVATPTYTWRIEYPDAMEMPVVTYATMIDSTDYCN